jgi:dihydroorotate dehydrogenase (NAD+) catalytic subunit
MKTPYDLTASFEDNVRTGFVWEDQFPDVRIRHERVTLFGKKLNSAFGIAACPLTHGSQSVSVCARLGYDMITYRSVRSIAWKGQVYPHWRYVDINKQVSVQDLASVVTASEQPFSAQEPSMANSFGIQSSSPEIWQSDFEKAKRTLLPGQLLILALMFTPETGSDIVVDAQTVAGYGKETSADVFEINLAHPNSGMKSLVYEDIETSVSICRTVKKTLGDRPLIAKVGYYKDQMILKTFLKETKGVLQGISSTNTYGMYVVDGAGQEMFPGRPKAGVSGAAIRTLSMAQAKTIVEYKKELDLSDFVVIGIGGITKPEHVKAYLDLGVDAAHCAVGAYADPLLASKYLQTL